MRKLLIGRLVVTLISLCAYSNAYSQSPTLTPTADAYIESGTPAANYGAASILLVRSTSTTTNLSRASFLQFDLSGLPAGFLPSVILRVYGRHETTGSGVPVSAYPGNASAQWLESQLTYNNAFSLTGVDFSGTPLATTTVAGGTAAYHAWDVTAFINQRRALGHATIGLNTNVMSLYRVSFNSKESTTNRPMLVVPINNPVQNWPMFGRDHNNSRAVVDTKLTPTNVGGLRVITRVVGAGVTGTPAVVDGKVYYSDAAGDLFSVNVKTGTVFWKRKLQTGVLTPSAYVGTDKVYTAGDGSTVYAVNRVNGQTIYWSSRIETTPGSRIFSSPIVTDNVLVIGTASTQVFSPASPVFRGAIVGLDANTGVQKWRTPLCTGSCSGISVWSSAAIDRSTRTGFIGTGQAYTAPAGTLSDALIAFNYDTGAIRWSYQFTPNDVYQVNVNDASKDRDIGSAPNLFEVNGRKLVGVGDKGGSYRVFDRATGQLVWSTRLSMGSAMGGIMHATAYADGRIYLVNNTESTSSSRVDGRPTKSIAYALNAANGSIAWQTPLDAGGFGGVSIAGELMYFMTWDGRLRVLRTSDGVQARAVTVSTGPIMDTTGFPGGSASGPVVADGYVYVGYGWAWTSATKGGLAILGL